MEGRSRILRRLVVSFVAAAGVVGIGIGFSVGGTGRRQPAKPAAVVSYSPASDDLDLRQALIGVTLAPGWTGALAIDGQEVPDDDLHRVAALNQITFAPQPTSDFHRPGPGQHRTTVFFWRVNQTRDQGSSYTWSFRLH